MPELWLVDTGESTIEVWRPEDAASQLARDTLTWRVAHESFEISLTEVFRALGAKGR